MNEGQIRQFLERYGNAMSTGDLPAILSCWEAPALVLSSEGPSTESDADEIKGFFAQAIDWYRSHGLVSTRAEVEQIDMLSDKIAAVHVRWPAFDETGKEKSSERSYYILLLGNDGQPRIRVAMTKTAE